jgi:hypothetical protein
MLFIKNPTLAKKYGVGKYASIYDKTIEARAIEFLLL